MNKLQSLLRNYIVYGVFFALFLLSACETGSSERIVWFKQYFTEAAQNPDYSQRMFNIWFGGDREAYTKKIFIGGNEKESAKWFTAVDDLLTGFTMSGTSASKFVFEMVVDKVTKASESLKFDELSKKFPNNFKVTLIEDIPVNSLPPQNIMSHATAGNAAFASDALRLWYLNNSAYDSNVYLDVDNFLDKIYNLSRYSNYKIFGREVGDGLYFSGNASDYLIDNQASQQKIKKVEQKGLYRYKNYKLLFDHYLDRDKFISSKNGFSEYKNALEKTVDYQLANESLLADIVAATIHVFGPSLWGSSSLGNDPSTLRNTADEDKVVSAQAWKEGSSIPVGDQTFTPKLLKEMIAAKVPSGSLADRDRLVYLLLSLNLLGWDQKYFSNFKASPLSGELTSYIKQLWQEANDIADNKLNEPLNTMVKNIKKMTGGFYLSLSAK